MDDLAIRTSFFGFLRRTSENVFFRMSTQCRDFEDEGFRGRSRADPPKHTPMSGLCGDLLNPYKVKCLRWRHFVSEISNVLSRFHRSLIYRDVILLRQNVSKASCRKFVVIGQAFSNTEYWNIITYDGTNLFKSLVSEYYYAKTKHRKSLVLEYDYVMPSLLMN